jgi:hypothetical protein
MKENESTWNQVIWQAIRDLRDLDKVYTDKAAGIDEVFSLCEKELYELKASKREAEIRLFALAVYCDKALGMDFFRSLAFSRFGAALDFCNFEHIAKSLIKENSNALVVFWVIFRLSFRDSLSKNCYSRLETRMKNKSFELGMNI